MEAQLEEKSNELKAEADAVTKGSDKVMSRLLFSLWLLGTTVFVQPNEPASLLGAGDELGYDTYMDYELKEDF